MTLTPEQLLAAYLGYERPAYVGSEHASTVKALRRVEAAVRADAARALPDAEAALVNINERLHIQACIVIRGNEMKCWVPGDFEDDPGVYKAYFNARECRELSAAFAAVAAKLETP
jgi:hypothetical protein